MPCKIESTEKGTRITCTRGARVPKVKLFLRDRQGNDWSCDLTRSEFEIKPLNIGIDVYNDEKCQKRFMKAYLEIVREA